MSLLLVALVPAFLMLATFGLSRLETGLAGISVSPDDVAEFLAQAEAADVRTLAQTGLPEALDHVHRRQSERIIEDALPQPSTGKHHADPFSGVGFAATARPGMPSRQPKHSRPNPQFTETRRVNSV